MSKIRVNKTKDYTVLSNHHLKNKNLSLKAKGLLSVMLSLPESWDYSIKGLVAICKENETAIKSTLNELKENGYLKVTKLYPSQTKSGRYEYIYDIYEMPKQDSQKQGIEKQGVENIGVEFLGVENIGLNKDTNKLNTKELNTNKENKVRFKKPTIEELEKYINENNLNVNAPYFYNYYESNGWKVGPNQMEDWKAKLKQWSLKEKTNKRELPTYHVMEDDNEGKEEIINSLKERWKE